MNIKVRFDPDDHIKSKYVDYFKLNKTFMFAFFSIM
jgi:hypothetical protein